MQQQQQQRAWRIKALTWQLRESSQQPLPCLSARCSWMAAALLCTKCWHSAAWRQGRMRQRMPQLPQRWSCSLTGQMRWPRSAGLLGMPAGCGRRRQRSVATLSLQGLQRATEQQPQQRSTIGSRSNCSRGPPVGWQQPTCLTQPPQQQPLLARQLRREPPRQPLMPRRQQQWLRSLPRCGSCCSCSWGISWGCPA